MVATLENNLVDTNKLINLRSCDFNTKPTSVVFMKLEQEEIIEISIEFVSNITFVRV